MDEKSAETVTLAAEIVAAYVGNNSVTISELPSLIRTVHAALSGVGAPVAAPVEDSAKPTPAQIRKSITPDALISFVDGRAYKTLKRHLNTHGMTIADYKARFGLPMDYPSTAPSYSESRSAMAKALGLGQGGRKSKSAAKPAKSRSS